MAAKVTVHWLMGKPDPKTGDATHALAAVITHVVVDKKGEHTAYAGDPKTATGVPISKEDWWALQGIAKKAE